MKQSAFVTEESDYLSASKELKTGEEFRLLHLRSVSTDHEKGLVQKERETEHSIYVRIFFVLKHTHR